MGKRYISEEIGDEFKEWKRGDVYLIKSPTGTGKSQFIMHQLYDWCRQNKKSLLLLSNRTLLNKQQKMEIQKVRRSGFLTFESCLYQSFKGKIEKYDYVVCDECHYFFEDSNFNRKTDILYKRIKNHSQGVVVLLSATPQVVESSLKDRITKKYSLPLVVQNYSLTKFNKSKAAISIIKQIRSEHPDEKIIYFSSSAKRAFNTASCFNNGAFICSKSNNKANKIDESQYLEIEYNDKFTCNLLCTTTALDNGINIKDKSVKHIIIDVFSPISIVQCFGRKRLDEDEEINLYLRDFRSAKDQRKKSLKQLEYYYDFINLSEQDFAEKYYKKTLGKILDLIKSPNGKYDFEVNECIRDYNEYMVRFCNDCLKNKNTYFNMVCTMLGVNPYYAYDFNENNNCENVELILEKWKDKMIYDKDKKLFREEFFQAIKGQWLDSRLRGENTINHFIQTYKLPYELKSISDWRREEGHRGRRYWIINENGSKNTV